jgi:hypothetical protein
LSRKAFPKQFVPLVEGRSLLALTLERVAPLTDKSAGVICVGAEDHRFVTRGKETFLLTENQSTYIPVGEVHRLHNPGKTPLEMIEVQSGGGLGEDDIVRMDDTYGRVVAISEGAKKYA